MAANEQYATHAVEYPIFEGFTCTNGNDGMLEVLPGLILRELRLLGLRSADIKSAENIIRIIGTVYDSMNLLDSGYHNHAHNLSVTFAMLLLVKDLRIERMSVDMLKTAFVAALFHDFHIRSAVFRGHNTEANVDETIRQLMDLLQVGVYRRQGEAATWSAYKDPVFVGPLMILKTQLDEFLPNGREKLSRISAALIRRTDFAAPGEVPAKVLTAAKKIRKKIIDEQLVPSAGAGPVGEREIAYMQKKITEVYRKVLISAPDNRKTSSTVADWAQKKLNIELDYLDALRGVSRFSPRLTRLVHRLATLLENGADKAGFYWMSSPSCIRKDVLPGLDSEVPFPVTDSGTYPFFFKTELLDPDVLKMINSLPSEYKHNFMSVMQAFASSSTAEADRLSGEKSSSEFARVLVGAQRDWQLKAGRIRTYFGLETTVLAASV